MGRDSYGQGETLTEFLLERDLEESWSTVDESWHILQELVDARSAGSTIAASRRERDTQKKERRKKLAATGRRKKKNAFSDWDERRWRQLLHQEFELPPESSDVRISRAAVGGAEVVIVWK